jgi:adenosylhomocysteine nucleosidase
MIGLIFATRPEAQPFLERSHSRNISTHPFRVYQSPLLPDLRILLCGIGKVKAALGCQVLIREHQAGRLINAGACGALQDRAEYAVLGLVRIVSAVEGDHTLFGKHLAPVESAGQIGRTLPPARLVTSDHPVFEQEPRQRLGLLGEVVDMEGAAIARTAALYRVAWDMIKGVTDQAGPMDPKKFQHNLDAVSEKIADLLWDALQQGNWDQKNL